MSGRTAPLSRPWLKPGILAGAMFPLVALGIGAWQRALGANPISEILNRLGLLAIVFLIATLACTPMRILFEWSWPGKVRRMLGLIAFVYASLHLLVYVVADQAGNFVEIWKDVSKRPFILAGVSAFALLVPLAATSTAKAVKRLGGRRWQRLHRFVYPAALLGALHFFMRVKRDATEPLVYAGIVLVLLLARLIPAWKRRQNRWTNASQG